jgi:hypothetical protein
MTSFVTYSFELYNARNRMQEAMDEFNSRMDLNLRDLSGLTLRMSEEEQLLKNNPLTSVDGLKAYLEEFAFGCTEASEDFNLAEAFRCYDWEVAESIEYSKLPKHDTYKRPGGRKDKGKVPRQPEQTGPDIPWEE